MPSDIRTSPPSLVPPQSLPPHGSAAPTSAASDSAQMAMDHQQIEAEEKVVVGKIDKLAELQQEYRQLIEQLTGNLSTYSREKVVQMSERAQILEQKLDLLQNPEQARTDPAGTDAPGL